MSNLPESIHEQDHRIKLAQLDDEVSGLKTDVGILQADVKTLGAGQVALQISQDKGFDEIKSIITQRSEAPPKISFAMLLTFLSFFGFVLVSGVGAFWAAVLLLYAPLKEDLSNYKLLEDRRFNRLNTRLDRFDEQRVKDAEFRGYVKGKIVGKLPHPTE